LVIYPFFAASRELSLLTQALIFAILASSLDLLLGYTGMTSLGHGAFFGTGAYTTGILVTHGIDNPVLAAPAGVLMAIVVAIFFGLVAVRTVGVNFVMVTLALGQMIFAVAWRWRSLTGGDDGLPGISRPDLGLPWPMTDSTNFYFFVLFFFVLCMVLMYRIVNSPFGHSLIGIRQNEPRMRALGYNTFVYKYICYIIAGGFSGVAGVLYAYFNGFVGPKEVGIATSGEALITVVVGGAGTLFGPALAAGIVVALKHFVTIYTSYWMLILGMSFVLIVIYLRRGIGGYLLQFWRKEVGGKRKP
jgi:branched-chain amino acid transport system permease protein